MLLGREWRRGVVGWPGRRFDANAEARAQAARRMCADRRIAVRGRGSRPAVRAHARRGERSRGRGDPGRAHTAPTWRGAGTAMRSGASDSACPAREFAGAGRDGDHSTAVTPCRVGRPSSRPVKRTRPPSRLPNAGATSGGRTGSLRPGRRRRAAAAGGAARGRPGARCRRRGRPWPGRRPVRRSARRRRGRRGPRGRRTGRATPPPRPAAAAFPGPPPDTSARSAARTAPPAGGAGPPGGPGPTPAATVAGARTAPRCAGGRGR